MKKLILSITKLILLSATLIISVAALTGCKNNEEVVTVNDTTIETIQQTTTEEDQAILDEDQICKAIYGVVNPVMDIILVQFINKETGEVIIEISQNSKNSNYYFITFKVENGLTHNLLTSYSISETEEDYVIHCESDIWYNNYHRTDIKDMYFSKAEYTKLDKLEAEAFRTK